MNQTSCRELFFRMLNALGSKNFDAFEACLHPDLLCEWPYVVMDGFPTSMRGGKRLRDMLEVSLQTFAPYAYQVQSIHETKDSGVLIAEYTSHSHYFPRDVPYENAYVGIFRFEDGLITCWREYVNPLVVLQTLGPGFTWREESGATLAP